MSPHHLRRGEHIVFGVDSVGIGICVSVTFVCSISCEPVVGFLPNFHGYNKLWHNKELIRFCDLDLIFKVTAVEKLKIHSVGTSVFSENIVLIFLFLHENIVALIRSASNDYPQLMFSWRNKKNIHLDIIIWICHFHFLISRRKIWFNVH